MKVVTYDHRERALEFYHAIYIKHYFKKGSEET